ncbi:hypothetical protein CEJ42_20790 [Herbaspirillum robiniae]|uniref:Tox-REase-5 domain-containing protein n=2 Tax=Herbaspirillum robiniae TaxID=2014887 RepID=A0A246WL66_9BURK|nr:hypothetical protein CEJ42_20790 [Herbaspirillum robiniae]
MVYQARITGMVLTDNYIEEWTYLGKNFDGFQLAECHLMEAKAGHDWIFDDELDVKYTFHRDILERMMEDAKAQNPLAMPRPPVKYSWYFEQPATYKYMLPILKRIGADINVHLQP